MKYLLSSSLVVAGLLAGCGGPLEQTWQTSCNNGAIQSITMDGENITFGTDRYLEPECVTLDTSVKQGGTYEKSDSKKEGVLNSIVITAGETVEKTLHTADDVKTSNETLKTNVENLLRAEEENARKEQIEIARGNVPKIDAQMKADRVRSAEKLKQVQAMGYYSLGTAKSFTRLQNEVAHVETLLAFGQQTSAQYQVDNGYLLFRKGATEAEGYPHKHDPNTTQNMSVYHRVEKK